MLVIVMICSRLYNGTQVKQTIDSGANVLFLNAGDYYVGSIWFYILGPPIVVDAVNYLKHDAMTLGNHEFDRGAVGLAPFLNGTKVPVLGCNIDMSEEPLLKDLQVKPSMVIEKGGHKIGLIGYVTPKTTYLSRPGKVRFTEKVECIQREARKLRAAGVSIIIAMGHSGVPRDVEICQSVPEVSLVVGGHTHTLLYSGPTENGKVSGDRPQGPYPTVVNRGGLAPCLVVQDFYMGKYMGNITVTWNERGDAVNWTGQPTLLDHTIPQDPDGLALLDKYREQVATKRKEPVGYTKVYLDGDRHTCSFGECNMGSLVMDAFLKKMAADPSENGSWSSVAAAIANSGSIRMSIDEQNAGGAITVEDVTDVLPFSNTLIVLNMTGSQLKDLFEWSVYRKETNKTVFRGGFLIVSGMRVVYDVHRKPGEHVVELQILCTKCRVPKFERVRDNEVYRIVTASYMITGGGNFNFSFIKPTDQFNTVHTWCLVV
ncbi:protein 5NUC-like [Haemaphysalis longicornis]